MNAIVPINAAPALTINDVEKVANAIARGGLFGSKDPFAVLTLCLLAQAEGQHPAVVFRDYHIINGKPAKKSEAMLRDFIMSGGKVEWHQLDDDCADATFSHEGGGSARISWDKARVAQAQLGGNAMHKKYPRQMLRSRVISEGVRTVFPGATSGLYVPEEVSSFENAAVPEAEQVSPLENAISQPHASPPETKKAREKLDGPYTSKSALWAAFRALDREIRGCGDEDQLDCLLATDDARALVAQCQRDAPQLISGGDGLPEEYIPLTELVHKMKQDFQSEALGNGNTVLDAG